MLGQILRFGGVGGLATAVHVLFALFLKQALALPDQQANLLGFAAAVTVSYLGHARFTFGVGARSVRQLVRFAISSMVALVTSSATVWLVTERLGYSFTTAMVTVALIVPMLTFVVLRFWVFGSRSGAAGSAASGASPTVLGLSALLSMVVLAAFWGRMLNHDTAWYLIATREWLAGAVLYVDIIEVNPPLNFYLTVPALELADLFAVSDTNGQYLLLSLLIFLSLSWSGSILASDPQLSPYQVATVLVGIAAAFVFPALDNIGQREQLLVIFAMPWMLRQVSSGPVRPVQEITAAAVAAIGVCLKPHFVVFPLAATLWHCVRLRSLRPVLSVSNLTFLVLGLAYVGYVALVHPTYLTDIVLVAREVYTAFRASAGDLLGPVQYETMLLVLPILVALATPGIAREGGFFLVLSVAGVASYLLQGTGFGNHAIPFRAYAMIACVWLILRTARPGTVVTALAVAVVICGLVAGAVRRGGYSNAAVTEIARVAGSMGKLEGVFVVTSHVYAGPPVATALGTDWASRYPHNWLVPGPINRLSRTDCAAEAEVCARLEAIAARNRADNIADIAERRPDLLIIDRMSGYFDTQPFDWLAFMAADPDWPAVFADYSLATSTNRFDYYRRRLVSP